MKASSLFCSLFLIAALLLFGCSQPTPTASPTPTAAATAIATATPTPMPTVEASPTPTPFPGLKLDYELQGWGPMTSFTVWLTEEKNCDGKKALNGFIQNFMGADAQNYAAQKITVYEDDGTVAYSNMMDKNKLAFNDAKTQAVDFDFLLTLNALFAADGQNFNANAVWSETTPTILNNVQFGGGDPQDISVSKTGESKQYAKPCVEFALIPKNGGAITVCVAKPGGDLPQPFNVNFASGSNSGNNEPEVKVTLKKASVEKPSLPFYAQCLEIVKCAGVTPPTQQEQQACQAKNSEYEPTRDDKNCITKYECKTVRDIVRSQLEGNQRPGCTVSEAVLSEAVKCRENHQNWNGVQGNDGCITQITCQ